MIENQNTPQKDISTLLKYLNERQKLFLDRTPPAGINVALVGYGFLIEQLAKQHNEVMPKFTRAVDMLEHLLTSFIEHSIDLNMLNDMEKLVYDV